MDSNRGGSFWVTIDRISNNGNGVVEKDGGGHINVGPIKEEVVGLTVKARMTGHNTAILVDPDLRKDVYAQEGGPTSEDVSVGEIVSGRITKQMPDGTPVLEKGGTRIKIPNAQLNEAVEVTIQSFSETNSQWVIAHGKRTREPGNTGGENLSGPVQSDTVLYDQLETRNSENVTCPVADCEYTGQPPSVAGHISGKPDANHNWQKLGYDGANAYKKAVPDSSEPPKSDTSLLYLSDSHLGASPSTNSGYSRESRCLKKFCQAIDVATDRSVEAVLNTGDLFHNDRHGIPEGVIEEAESQLRRLSKEGITFYSIDGDHEREAGREVLESFEKEGLLTRLGEEPRLVGDGIALYGRDYTPPEGWTGGDWSPDTQPANRFSILALHQSITPISNNEWPDCSVEDVATIAKPHIHAIAAGHHHLTGIEWHDELPFVLGGTTEPERAGHTSSSPTVGQFIQDENTLRYQRLQLPA